MDERCHAVYSYWDNIMRMFGTSFVILAAYAAIEPSIVTQSLIIGVASAAFFFTLFDLVEFYRDRWFEAGVKAGKYEGKEMTWKTFKWWTYTLYTFRYIGVYCIVVVPVFFAQIHLKSVTVERVSDFALLAGFGLVFWMMGEKQDKERSDRDDKVEKLWKTYELIRTDAKELLDIAKQLQMENRSLRNDLESSQKHTQDVIDKWEEYQKALERYQSST